MKRDFDSYTEHSAATGSNRSLDAAEIHLRSAAPSTPPRPTLFQPPLTRMTGESNLTGVPASVHAPREFHQDKYTSYDPL